jgi:hypothetical protein
MSVKRGDFVNFQEAPPTVGEELGGLLGLLGILVCPECELAGILPGTAADLGATAAAGLAELADVAAANAGFLDAVSAEVAAEIGQAEGLAQQAAAETGRLAEEAEGIVGPAAERQQQIASMLSNAADMTGYDGMGIATREEAMAMGETWVGPGFRVASDGKTLVSEDALRTFRPPSFKPNRPDVFGGPGYQANFS